MRIIQEHGENVRVVEAAVEVNAAQKTRMVKKTEKCWAVPKPEKPSPS